jgi:hypothetical protein
MPAVQILRRGARSLFDELVWHIPIGNLRAVDAFLFNMRDISFAA